MIEGPTLIVAAHPDDEVLGAGGWMARFPGTLIAIVSEGTSMTVPPPDPRVEEENHPYTTALAVKRMATRLAAAMTESGVVWEGDYPDQCLHLVGQERESIAKALTRIIEEYRPQTVLTHAPTDLNQDHRVVAEAVMVATRGYAGSEVRRVLGFVVDPVQAPAVMRGGGEFFLTLSEADLALKLKACAAYGEEMRGWPHPRSIPALEYLARWSGARIGRPAAEPYTFLWGCQ